MSRRFPAPQLGVIGTRVTLDAATSHHLLTVSLVPRGESVRLFHEGLECDAVLVDGSAGAAVLEIVSTPSALTAGAERVLLLGLTRKPAWERVLRMATELGVSDIRPFIGRHSVAKGEHLERWRRIVAEASRQSERGVAPTVQPLAELADLLEGSTGTRLALCPGAPAGAPTTLALTLLIGPEGGLHRDEVQLALDAGFVRAGLGPTVLRADTAAVAALARYAL